MSLVDSPSLSLSRSHTQSQGLTTSAATPSRYVCTASRLLGCLYALASTFFIALVFFSPQHVQCCLNASRVVPSTTIH